MAEGFQRNSVAPRTPSMSQTSTETRQCALCTDVISIGTKRVSCSHCRSRFHIECFENSNLDPLISTCPACGASNRDEHPCDLCEKPFKINQLVKVDYKDRSCVLCETCLSNAKKDMEEEDRKETEKLLEKKRDAGEKTANENAAREQAAAAKKIAKENAAREKSALQAKENAARELAKATQEAARANAAKEQAALQASQANATKIQAALQATQQNSNK